MRPCRCDNLPPAGEPYAPPYCRLCWLYAHDADYRRLWDNQADQAGHPPQPNRGLPCIYLGTVEDRLGCPCPGKWVRKCDLHGRCTLETCKTCRDYEPGN
jgi:hypothetical protein